MIIANDVEIPDECPKDCPGLKEPLDMSSICFRCPILNCKKSFGHGGEDDFCLIKPKDYRHDWAVEWRKWFEEGMNNYPDLYLEQQTCSSCEVCNTCQSNI